MTTISLLCSPDADDLFMMRALLEGMLDTGDLEFTIDTSPTDALNRAGDGRGPDVLALSMAHYPRVAEHYQLLPHGGSMGEGYGPVIVAPEPVELASLSGARIAVPGLTTTAYRVLRMMLPEVDPVVTPISPYHLIFDELRAGRVDAGLIIHEGRLTYEDEGFALVADQGEWWAEQTGGLPLPLGGNSIARRLGAETIARVSDLLRQSIAHGLEHRDEAIDWLLERDGPLDTRERVDEYLGMYANQRTLDYGPEGRAGIEELLRRIGWDGAVDFAP